MASAPTHARRTPADFKIPRLIKRNIVLFSLAQSFTGAGMQFAYGFGPLMVVSLSGSAALAGLSVAILGLSRFFISYPIGKITDTYGRKPGILLGLTLGLIGALVVGWSMALFSFWIFVGGMFVFGMGMNAAQQLRVAATDMFPPWHRAQALGYIATGSLAGLAVSPVVVSIAEPIAHRTGHDPLGLPWFLLPVLIIPGMFLIRFVRPDPKEIGANLERYYPGYKPEPRPPGADAAKFTGWDLLRHPRMRRAIIANCAGQGNMSIVMVLTSLVLSQHGHSLSAIALAHMFHSCGMFAFTIPLGRLSDRFGREAVMYPGVCIALLGACLVALTTQWWSVTLGTFLVGLGWAAANVSATAMIADLAEVHVRGRAIGVNESFSGGTAMALAVVTGPLIEWSGLPATGLAAAAVAAPPLLLWLATRMRAAPRPSPG
jgi:MFS family permease